ncbi:hypothetical protein DXG03_001642 [Asterophora parasitica]|uniref:Uncharacterized protein n=1 Tax=Asterophora parasitica TaxID=117018 RepID=A0A9P7G975_9AGAR|nr:hypothetical protein DXG03_001642 [Asterophora parasitica]
MSTLESLLPAPKSVVAHVPRPPKVNQSIRHTETISSAHGFNREDNFCRCTKCKTVIKDTDPILDAVRIGQEALDKATSLQFKDPSKALQLTTNLIPILTSTGLTPSSHPLLALARLHQSLLIASLPTPPTQDTLDNAIHAATRSSTGLASVLTFGHPVRGIVLAELGKLLSVDEPSPRELATPAEAALLYPPSGPSRLKLAYEMLLRARVELLVGFGARNEGCAVGREVRGIIVALEKEIGVWKQGKPAKDATLTAIETTIPGGEVVYGFSLLDRLYLRKGTFYVVTSDTSTFPSRKHMIARPLDIGSGRDVDPTDKELQFITLAEAREVLGERALVVEGFSMIPYDTEQFMNHIFGNEWRDAPGVNAGLLRTGLTSTNIEKSDLWDDFAVIDKTIVFERAMIISRAAAHTQ